MYETLAVLAAFAFVYSVVAPRLERTPVSGAVVFLAFGLLAGPGALGLLDLTVRGARLESVASSSPIRRTPVCAPCGGPSAFPNGSC